MHHLFSWMMVFGLWYFLRYQDYATPQRAFTVTMIKVTDLALMVYTTNYLLIPHLLYKKQYGWFALAFIVLIVVSSLVKMQVIGRVINSPALMQLSGNVKARIYDNIIPHFFLVLSGAAFKLMADYTRMQQRMAEMAKEKAEAELNFLKSQINPHFLFNSINSVYFLIDKGNEAARDALHKFSGMLRYQLYEMNGDKIPVEKEIAYLQDYVDLQRIRTDENHAVTFNCSDAVSGFLIEPLLLIPFLENAFKHCSHYTDRLNFIAVNLWMNDGVFHFTITNSTEEIETTAEAHNGIGLVNVKRRLELLYPGKHLLAINASNESFSVELQLNSIK